MPDLHVDTDSLNAVAAGADIVAESLTTGPTGESGSQPSEVGVAALDVALSAVQERQSTRVSENASELRVSAASYTTIDNDRAEDISRAL